MQDAIREASGGSSRKLSKTFASFPRGWTTWKLKTEHGGILQQLQEANREVRARLERLEKNPGPTSAPGSTVAPSDEGRKPALVIGGWDADQDAKTTREEATDILRSVSAPICLENMFVPGVRRGYAILPIPIERIQGVISKVRDANVHLGSPDGGARRL